MITDDVLTQWYELVVLRRTRSGRLVLEGCQLFPPSAQSGDRQRFTVWCEPSDENGTVFAVVATEPVRQFQLVSVESASLARGSYDLTAELMRPGHVRFHGLPADLHADHRSWPELVAAIPARINFPEPAHLICSVEVSGAPDQVQERISRIEQLIGLVADTAERQLSVSVISYGPHSFDWKVAEEPPQMLTWGSTSEEALSALADLRDRGPAETGYSRAAQLECVLARVARRLTGQHGRPVLVTVGSRPAFPHRLDPVSEILPCPERNDWRRAWQQIRTHRGSAFGAIRDNGRRTFGASHDNGKDGEIWPRLGSDAIGHVSAVNIRRFAADLGLLSFAVQPIPFPIVEKAGS